jgi:hypothetical protein
MKTAKERMIEELELEFQHVTNGDLTEEQTDDSYQCLLNQLDIIYKGQLANSDYSVGLWEFRSMLDIIDELKMTYPEAIVAAAKYLEFGSIPGTEEVEPLFIDDEGNIVEGA